MEDNPRQEPLRSEFFPIAFLSILFLLAFVVPIMVPASLFHIWLWLRHPRTRRHYWIAAGLIAFPLGLFIVLPVIGNAIYARDGHGPEGLIRTRYLPSMLMMLAGAGVVPLLYRFCSSNSLGPNTNADRDSNAPSSSIIDKVAFIVLVAVVYLASQMVDDPTRYDFSPLWSLMVSVVVSVLAIGAMRINARCHRGQLFANFAVIWLGGWLILKGTLWGIDTVVRPLVDGPNPDPVAGAHWLFIQYRSAWESLASGAGTLAIAIFPLICRRYGLVLLPHRIIEEEKIPRDQITADRDGGVRRFGSVAGHLCLLLMIALLTLYPFTWTEKYVSTGYRVFGWPLVYCHADQTTPSEAPWYWTDSSIWRTTDFHASALVIDVLLTLAAWLVIFPPSSLRDRISSRSIRFARWTLGAAFVFGVSWDAYLSTLFRDWRLERMESVTVDMYLRDGDFSLIERIAHEMDTQWRGTEERLKRGGPAAITIRGGSADEVDVIIRRHPTLKALTLQNCDLTAKRVSELAMDPRLDVFHFVSDDDRDEGIVRAVRSDRDPVNAIAYTLELTVSGGEVFVPDGVGKLELVIPHRRDSTFELKGMADLNQLEVRNTFGEVPTSVSKIRIKQAPKLEVIRLDTMQKFDLEVESAPQLDTLVGLSTSIGTDDARLTRLKLSDVAGFDTLHLNLTDLLETQVRGNQDELQINGLRLSVDQTPNSMRSAPPAARSVLQLVRELSAIRLANNLELNGLVCHDAFLRDLPTVRTALVLKGCVFSDDVSPESFERLTTITDLCIENLDATSQQIDALKNCARNTIVVNNRGAFRVEAVMTTAPPHIADITDWLHNAYYKMAHYLPQLTENAEATGNPGTFDLQVSDPSYIATGMQILIDDARASGVTVRINP